MTFLVDHKNFLSHTLFPKRNKFQRKFQKKQRVQVSFQLAVNQQEKKVQVADRFGEDDWRRKSKPIQPGSSYPAKEYCSHCGLCDTYYVAKVKEACAFLGDGMSKIEKMEEQVHGRSRSTNSNDELHFGVNEEMLYARNVPGIEGAQWTGIVTQVAVEMLNSGKVDAVVCVQSDANDRFQPRPVVATTAQEILDARGVKPCLSTNLEVLATVEALDVKKLLFIGTERGHKLYNQRSIGKNTRQHRICLLFFDSQVKLIYFLTYLSGGS
eukprot:TRINITY_DN1346_c3_g2_i1.p1 TRINITY_DN1346_c3_g2~~TRINITY_DN1346_c3_g2_i1.p1  ORF type:complete len:268 (-),score=27.90 TRINITY_DN1346_c3_g2_i1:52-855(-)